MEVNTQVIGSEKEPLLVVSGRQGCIQIQGWGMGPSGVSSPPLRHRSGEHQLALSSFFSSPI